MGVEGSSCSIRIKIIRNQGRNLKQVIFEMKKIFVRISLIEAQNSVGGGRNGAESNPRDICQGVNAEGVVGNENVRVASLPH